MDFKSTENHQLMPCHVLRIDRESDAGRSACELVTYQILFDSMIMAKTCDVTIIMYRTYYYRDVHMGRSAYELTYKVNDPKWIPYSVIIFSYDIMIMVAGAIGNRKLSADIAKACLSIMLTEEIVALNHYE